MLRNLRRRRGGRRTDAENPRQRAAHGQRNARSTHAERDTRALRARRKAEARPSTSDGSRRAAGGDRAKSSFDPNATQRLASQRPRVTDAIGAARANTVRAAGGRSARRDPRGTIARRSDRHARRPGTQRDYLATLAGRRRLNDAQISRVDALARASAATSISASATEAASAASTPPEADYASGARTVTLVATGYSLSGATATGLPVGWGTVAVDPSVIPLGTRMTIPGYGDGVAADTGSAVQGTTVDLWFPSVPQALAWGRRVVTVTLH